MNNNGFRVLLLADDCNPCWPSLPVVGYNLVKAISNHMPVVLATHVRNKNNLELFPLSNVEIVYIDNEYIAKNLYRLGLFLRGGNSVGWTTQVALNYPSYLAFEWEVFKKFKKEFQSRDFALIHRITPMSPTLPSLICHKTSIPFVLGPLNGGLAWPNEFIHILKKEREWVSWLRNISHYLPYYQSTYSRSAAILAAFKHTIDDLPLHLEEKIFNFPEVGFDPDLFYPEKKMNKLEKITFLFVGRLVPYKNADILLEAFTQSPILRKHSLKIVGEGPEMTFLNKYVKEHALEDCITLLGNKTQKEVSDIMRESDVFVFPSIRELGAGVVIEAMACGLCCIVVDYGGPAWLIASDRGIKVPLQNKKNLIDSMKREMENLVLDREKIKRLGLSASKYANNLYTWDSKARQIIRIYDWILGKENVKPSCVY